MTESTPLDIEVAVDPEMLGKVFEELVTGRHGTGSYYTPRPVVSFMCRESLKICLQNKTDETLETLKAFVDDGDATAIRDPEKVLKVLQNLRICDPSVWQWCLPTWHDERIAPFARRTLPKQAD